MTVRPYKPEDGPALKAIYDRMGFDYPFPDLNAGQFVSVWVVVDAQDKPVMALAARKTVETYLFMDKEWQTPAWRLEAFRDLHLACHLDVKGQGFTDAQCAVPPEVAKAFGRRLVKVFGWVKSRWTVFSKEL